MDTVLISGAAGYIGLHTALEFLDHGYQVVGLDNLSNSPPPPELEGFSFYEGDVGDDAFVAGIFEAHPNVTSCLHFASSVYVAESLENPELYHENNVVKGLRFLENCKAHGVDQFIFSSSASVYGPAQSDLIDETHVCAPIHPYGQSKLDFEDGLRGQDDLRFVILRYFNAAGADKDKRAGQNTKKIAHLIKAGCAYVTGKLPDLVVSGDDYDTPDGTCVRDYIHVSDLAAVHRLALEYLNRGGDSTVLNCGYGKGFSVLEIVERLKEVSGKDFETKFGPRRPGDVAQLVCDNTRLKDTLGWAAHHDDLDLIVRSALEWERSIKTDDL